MANARATEALSTTSSAFTSSAPTAPSVIMKKTPQPAQRRRSLPEGELRRANQSTTSDSRPSRAEVTRWVNSMIVSIRSARGIHSPLHRGQWSAQPAPEPVTRTNAPQRITRTV